MKDEVVESILSVCLKSGSYKETELGFEGATTSGEFFHLTLENEGGVDLCYCDQPLDDYVDEASLKKMLGG